MKSVYDGTVFGAKSEMKRGFCRSNPEPKGSVPEPGGPLFSDPTKPVAFHENGVSKRGESSKIKRFRGSYVRNGEGKVINHRGERNKDEMEEQASGAFQVLTIRSIFGIKDRSVPVLYRSESWSVDDFLAKQHANNSRGIQRSTTPERVFG